jgi:hypothetical protein
MARKKKNDEEPIENQDNLNNDSDDTFGLPEVAYEPLKREETEPPAEPVPTEPVEEPVENTTPVEEPVYEKPYEPEPVMEHNYQQEEHHDYNSHYGYVEDRPSVWPKVIAIGVLVILALGAVYYFAVLRPDQQKEEARRELAEKLAADKEAKKRQRELEEQAKRDREQRRLDSLAAIPKEGSMEVLSERTGQYYIVVASAIDDDLLTDYASALVKNGKNVKIIPPFGKTGKFYRLAVDSKDNYTDAQAAADGMKGGDFGDQLWVVKF